MTLGDRMVAANKRPAGFDYIRLVLATAVILHHSFTVTSGGDHANAMWDSPDRAVIGLIVPMFFSLSGYLVASSLERNNSLISFLGLRAIRLVPALAVEVTLSALILGPLLTSLPLSSYFHSPVLRHYFMNIVGNIHYELPGVFAHNPTPSTVNAQLWTIPLELKCYLVLAGMAAFGIAARPRPLLWFLLLVQVAVIPTIVFRHLPPSGQFHGSMLVGAFLVGLAMYKYKERIPSSAAAGLGCLALTSALFLVPYGFYFMALPVSYATVWLGTLNPPRNRFLLSGDYSYGLYLYGFPLQQAFTTLGAWTYVWWMDFLCVYPAAFAFAALSWWAVEKPASKLKKHVMTCEGWALRVPPIAWHSRTIFQSS